MPTAAVLSRSKTDSQTGDEVTGHHCNGLVAAGKPEGSRGVQAAAACQTIGEANAGERGVPAVQGAQEKVAQ